jgi:hypothetical protein
MMFAPYSSQIIRAAHFLAEISHIIYLRLLTPECMGKDT